MEPGSTHQTAREHYSSACADAVNPNTNIGCDGAVHLEVVHTDNSKSRKASAENGASSKKGLNRDRLPGLFMQRILASDPKHPSESQLSCDGMAGFCSRNGGGCFGFYRNRCFCFCFDSRLGRCKSDGRGNQQRGNDNDTKKFLHKFTPLSSNSVELLHRN